MMNLLSSYNILTLMVKSKSPDYYNNAKTSPVPVDL